ncbi:DUF1778 domain-containing protein [Telmatospirillum sp.]|uniref:type II toxin-antitoxin system TacA family antitoxin n=1 Tax=Telmatospirillum sp. TaxID=2079197 RepID=UPI0028482B77|nr:DUF1778 domain-containing protein [Telmatospirillum sp.]MDR3435488.1 DUF1778 domain-containing protein [Telmatospirillum sp.]
MPTSGDNPIIRRRSKPYQNRKLVFKSETSSSGTSSLKPVVGSAPVFREAAPAEKARLMRAAALERTSLKDFVLRNALLAAEAVIEKAERTSLDEEQTRFILELLDNPPKPNAKLQAAARALAARE